MPTYESSKYCGHVDCKTKNRCDDIAYHECSCGDTHPDDSWAKRAEEVANHPRFVCRKHIEFYDD